MMESGKGDCYLLALLLAVLAGAFWLFAGEEKASLYAEIRVEGELCKRIELTGHRGKETVEIVSDRGRNLIQVEDESICVLEADCPDKVCVKTGSLSKNGQTAACLPHKLLLEIKEGPLP